MVGYGRRTRSDSGSYLGSHLHNFIVGLFEQLRYAKVKRAPLSYRY